MHTRKTMQLQRKTNVCTQNDANAKENKCMHAKRCNAKENKCEDLSAMQRKHANMQKLENKD